MNEDAEMDRFKIKQYHYERWALIEFIDQHADSFSPHVKNAVSYRLGVIHRELKILEGFDGKGAKGTEVKR